MSKYFCRHCAAFVGFGHTCEVRIRNLESQNKKLIEVLKRLSQTGDGSHGDKHASFYDCLPTLQIEFDERIGFARAVLKEIEND